MGTAVVAAHRDDAAVASADAAAHDALDRHLTRTAVLHRDARGGGEHAFGSARVDHDRRVRIACCETSIERSEEHTSELQSLRHLVCRPLPERKTLPCW